MWFFDLIFGSTKRRKVSFDEKSKLTRQDVIDLVWGIQSLDSKQKKIVEKELFAELDDGGVSKWEYREVIRQLATRRVELGLSQIDIKNLRKIL